MTGDLIGGQLIGSLSPVMFSPRAHAVAVSTHGKGRTMLNAALGMGAMVPVVFGVAGYVLVSR